LKAGAAKVTAPVTERLEAREAAKQAELASAVQDIVAKEVSESKAEMVKSQKAAIGSLNTKWASKEAAMKKLLKTAMGASKADAKASQQEIAKLQEALTMLTEQAATTSTTAATTKK